MDTTKLKVGQKLVMGNGPLGGLGTVVKIPSEGVIVRIDLATGPMPENSMVQFDSNGKVRNSKNLGYRGPENNGLPCSFECSTPWELTEHEAAAFYRANGHILSGNC